VCPFHDAVSLFVLVIMMLMVCFDQQLAGALAQRN
jgi:hypothetical protein